MGSDWRERLLTDLAGDDGRARLQARETLAAIGEPALDLLVGLLDSPEPRLRWEAAKALAEIPEPAAIPGLVALLGGGRSDIGWLAAVALINLGTRSVPHVLLALTQNENAGSKPFCKSAHHVLHDLAARNGVLRDILEPVLVALEDSAPDVGVIAAQAEKALAALRALHEG
ncbi:MAG: HEAT repeat domain-containing protein [Actinomycetia bacterium]|nr:HEAT repeat domain-containing protein [Actinomycetes bacterium]